MNKIFLTFTVLAFCFSILFSCGPDTNEYAIAKAEDVINRTGNSLDSISPICDSIFLDSCNVFYVLTSPTTTLFAQGAEIDNLYYEGCMREASEDQRRTIIKLLTKPDLDDIGYLKGVYIEFGLSYLNHSEEGVRIVKIFDKLKFDRLFQFTPLKSNNQNSPQTNWIYHFRDDWYVVSGNLIHSGNAHACSILRGK